MSRAIALVCDYQTVKALHHDRRYHRVTMPGQPFAVTMLAALVLCACAQAPTRPDVSSATTAEPDAVTAVAGVEGHFSPTEAAGGGANAAAAISRADLALIFAAIPGASQLDLAANSSPPGATGVSVTSVSVTGTDTAGLFTSLDPSAKRALGDALLTAAAGAWPNASISLLLTNPSSVGGQIIGSHVKGDPNTVIVS